MLLETVKVLHVFGNSESESIRNVPHRTSNNIQGSTLYRDWGAEVCGIGKSMSKRIRIFSGGYPEIVCILGVGARRVCADQFL